ncbi:uncharacterized protein LOC124931315 [Impatiens glandulifera]|uniref:uncharacterized protein LOC124931315 n=1 Tax=Impatiens glandulifera TaxID=253017 RepID=UPI001FB13FF2|nr:uncharacterized protein LOC124931315 [Impatiens glandulifera]
MNRKGNNKLSKPWDHDRGVQVPLLIAICILVLVSFLILLNKDENPSSSPVFNNTLKSPSVIMNPTLETTNGTDFIWQIPDSPKAVLFIAHGCNGEATNFWDKSPTCETCIGLPEERLIVLNALSRNFAVLVISSAGRCWSFGEERVTVKETIQNWVTNQKLEKLPLVGLGASSGGYFISVLAIDMKFSSIVIMIAEGKFSQLDMIKEDYPPSLFIHMPKDEYRKEYIRLNIRMLRGKGVDVEEIECLEFPIEPDYFARRIRGIDMNTSIKLLDLFRDKGFVDGNGYMRKDGRALDLKGALEEGKIELKDKKLIRHVQEEMNLAFGYHEMTSLQSEKMFQWFESHF